MLLVARDPVYREHDPGPGHPERPIRLRAVEQGIAAARIDDAIVALGPRDATAEELERVHSPRLVARLEALCAAGGGAVDPDTVTSSGSFAAALRAAGSGLAAADALQRGEGEAAFLAVRPPGHHARPSTAMGFCLFNSVAVTAAALAEQGARVCIVDYDAHHGNGTQEIFYADARVLYVSFHEWPLYPGTGRLHEAGAGEGVGSTCNFPLPSGATGDVYLRALDEVVAPVLARFDPTWVLVSCGFDAHRDDPLTGLGLSAGDYGLLAARVTALAPAGRLIVFLEGGYDLDALESSVAATLPPLLGLDRQLTEPPTAGGPGGTVVDAAGALWAAYADGGPEGSSL